MFLDCCGGNAQPLSDFPLGEMVVSMQFEDPPGLRGQGIDAGLDPLQRIAREDRAICGQCMIATSQQRLCFLMNALEPRLALAVVERQIGCQSVQIRALVRNRRIVRNALDAKP